jgi:heptaprenyl diphosphate synthase
MNSTRRLTHVSLLVALALALHSLETALPLPGAVPGARLGLANIITLLALLLYGFRTAMFVATVRSVLGSFFAGNFLGFAFYLSLAGAVFSTMAMALALWGWRRGTFSLPAVSVIGAVVHNTAQVALASLLIGNINLLRLYLPLLLLLAVPAGIITGMIVFYVRRVLMRAVHDLPES